MRDWFTPGPAHSSSPTRQVAQRTSTTSVANTPLLSSASSRRMTRRKRISLQVRVRDAYYQARMQTWSAPKVGFVLHAAHTAQHTAAHLMTSMMHHERCVWVGARHLRQIYLVTQLQ